MVISIVCLFFTGISASILVKSHAKIIEILLNDLPHKTKMIYGIVVGASALFYVFSIMSQILITVGSSKKIKRLLVPFMVFLVLDLLFVGINWYWNIFSQQSRTPDYSSYLILNIPLFFKAGITSYFLVIVVRFYKELSSRDRLQTGLVLTT